MFTLVVEDIERFKAEVQDALGNVVYRIDGREIIQSAIMKTEQDIEGLTRYLRKRKVLGFEDVIDKQTFA